MKSRPLSSRNHRPLVGKRGVNAVLTSNGLALKNEFGEMPNVPTLSEASRLLNVRATSQGGVLTAKQNALLERLQRRHIWSTV